MRQLFGWSACLWLGGLLWAADAPVLPVEQQIEALLTRVAARQDVQFVRNGQAYDAATAVKFLRGKWDRQKAEIKTVGDFIDKVASRSSTTGQPYLIRFADGQTVECRVFLTRLWAHSTKNENATSSVGPSAPSSRPSGDTPSGK